MAYGIGYGYAPWACLIHYSLHYSSLVTTYSLSLLFCPLVLYSQHYSTASTVEYSVTCTTSSFDLCIISVPMFTAKYVP